MPEVVVKMARSVRIYHDTRHITCLRFYDRDKKYFWEIGHPWGEVTTVELAADEVIIGVVAKLLPGF